MVAEGGGSSGPVLLLPTEEKATEIEQLSAEIQAARAKLKSLRSTVASSSDVLKDSTVEVPRADATFPFDGIRAEEIKTKGTIHRVVRNTPIDKIVDDNPHSVASGEPKVVAGKIGNALRVQKEYLSLIHI